MKKLDRRIVRTHKALRDALVGLSLEKGYGTFSVRTLTKRAGVSYPTFYRHFKSIDELLRHVLMAELELLKRIIDQQDSLYAEAVAKYSHIAGNPGVYRLYVSLPKDNPMRPVVSKALANWFIERFEARDASNAQLALTVNHAVESCIGLLRWYLDNLEQYSPEEVAAIYSDLLLRATSAVAIAPREDWLNRL